MISLPRRIRSAARVLCAFASLREVALLCAIFCAAAFAGETPLLPTKPKGDPLADIEWSALRQSPEEKGAIVLSGSAWVRYQGAKLEADNIVFYRATREMYAEGHVRLHAGESEITAEAAYIDVNNDVGYLIDSTIFVSGQPNSFQNFGKIEEPKEREINELDFIPAPERGRKVLPVDAELVKGRDPYGVYFDANDDPQARAHVLFRAERIIKHSKILYSADKAFITSDDMAHPLYGVNADHLDFYLRQVPDPDAPDKTDLLPHKIVAKGARLNIMGTKLLPLPKLTYDFSRKNPYVSMNAGRSKRFGPFLLMRIGMAVGSSTETKTFDPRHLYFDIDERANRGPAFGFEMDWHTGTKPLAAPGEKVKFDRGSGQIRAYGVDEIQIDREDDLQRARRDLERRIQPKIDGRRREQFDANLLFLARRRLDNAGPPSLEIDRHGDEERGIVDFQHHQPIPRVGGIENIQLDFVYERETDRDFKLEYFQRNYYLENQPQALFTARKAGDNYNIEVMYRGQPQEFDSAPPRSPVDFGTFTTYQPAATYTLNSYPLGKGFMLFTEVQAANLRRDFERTIYNQDALESVRGYGIIDIVRPVKAGPFSFVPRIGTQQAMYGDSREGGGAHQGAITWGFDATTRLYGTFEDMENESIGVHGFRHIIEPRLEYRGIGDTLEQPETIFDFDEIDDFRQLDRVTISLDQSFQTRRANKEGTVLRTYTFAGLDIAADFYPRAADQNRLLEGKSLDLIRTEGFFRVHELVRLDAGLGFNMQGGKFETGYYGITVDPNTRWRVRFDERYNYSEARRAIEGSDQYRLRVEYQISERWGIAVEEIHEQRKSLLHRKGRQVERISVMRSYGPVVLTVSYAVDRNQGENSLFATIRPALIYRNVIVPSQDLLVKPGEVTGDDVAPEENNFDPFDLLKRRRGGRKPSPAPQGPSTPAPNPSSGTGKPPAQ